MRASVVGLVLLVGCGSGPPERDSGAEGINSHPFGGEGQTRVDALVGDTPSDGAPGDTGSPTRREPDARVHADISPPLDTAIAPVPDAVTEPVPDAVTEPAPDVSIADVSPDAVQPALGELVSDGAFVLDTHPTVNYRGVDSAWSPAADAFLVVHGNAPIGGALLSGGMSQIGPGFLLTGEPYDGANWTQNPRVVANDSGWLASWHKELPGGPVVQVRHVRREGDGPAFDGPAYTVSGPASKQESPAALAYVPTTKEHIVVWAADGLRARRLGAGGAPLGDEVTLSVPGIWVEFPSAAWHPACACVFVAYMKEESGAAQVMLARLDGATGQLLGPPTDLTGGVAFAKVTDVELDAVSGQMIATWYEVRDGVAGFGAQRFAGDGTPVTAPTLVFAPFGSYDGYDLAWSAVTGTSLATFHSAEVAALAAELAPDLTYSPAIPLDLGGAINGAYLPRAVAHPSSPAWLVAFSPDYAGVVVQRVSRE